MKNLLFLFVLLFCFITPFSVFAEDISNAQILEELRALKSRVENLEKQVQIKDREIKEMKKEREKILASVSSKERSDAVKDKKWFDRIDVSGAIELEFSSDSHDLKNPANGFQGFTSTDQDHTLATFELGLDTEIHKYAQAHVVLLFEEDSAEEFSVDEGTIMLGGIEETYGLYLLGGKLYPHFGELNSYFVSSPLTAEVFEIGETGLQVGYENDWLSAGVVLFHGDAEDKSEDNSKINGYVADLNFHNPEGTLQGLSLMGGASYLSNVADSDTLQGELNDINGDGNTNDLTKTVDGFAVYLVADYDRFSFSAEYITALDEFQAGEMAYALDRNGVARKTEPSAWNTEFAFRPVEELRLAVKYEGSDEMFGLFPEKQYGFAASIDLFRCTTLSAEYLHGEYNDNNQNADGNVEDERDLITLLLAVKF